MWHPKMARKVSGLSRNGPQLCVFLVLIAGFFGLFVTVFTNDEMVYEMNHIWTADMKSSEAMIFAVMNAIFAIA